MRFYFRSNDTNLTKAAHLGGCGVTAEEIAKVTVWQTLMTYQFEFHLENHGEYVYIFPDGRRAGMKDMPRFYFGGGRKGLFDNEESVKSNIQKDVEKVVTNNYDLFARMHARFYRTSSTPTVVSVAAPVPVVTNGTATLTCTQCNKTFAKPNPHLVQNDMTNCPNCGGFVYAG